MLLVWLPYALTTSATALTAPKATAITEQIPAVTSQSAGSITATIKDCTPSGFTMPAAVNLTTANPGLTTITDQPETYTIYGNTMNDIRSQIMRCAPGANGNVSAEFTAQTAYNLVWNYSMVTTDSCHLTDVRVGLRIKMSLPNWQAGTSVTPGLTTRWQTFITNLLTHENGHAALDTQYAEKMVNDLNGADCSNAKNITDTDVAALNAANDAYDATTNHGATQGAILPSY